MKVIILRFCNGSKEESKCNFYHKGICSFEGRCHWLSEPLEIKVQESTQEVLDG